MIVSEFKLGGGDVNVKNISFKNVIFLFIKSKSTNSLWGTDR